MVLTHNSEINQTLFLSNRDSNIILPIVSDKPILSIQLRLDFILSLNESDNTFYINFNNTITGIKRSSASFLLPVTLILYGPGYIWKSKYHDSNLL